jgi:short-subunit dehydrogenase
MVARIRGLSVLITGASSGIGAATALSMARGGARLALCARRLDRLNSLAERCRQAGAASVSVRRVDISRRAEAMGFVAGALRDFDSVDVLVNNAGIGWRGRLQDLREEDAKALVDTNVLGVLWPIQAALPGMLTANRGHIINVASVAGFRAVPYSALYSATKHAVVGLSHALRGELSGTGIKVTAVYPGTTATEFFEGQRIPKPAHSAEWVARAIVRTVRWPRRDVIILPYRLGQLAEPLLGGPLDHVIGEIRRGQLGLRGGDGGVAEPPKDS